MNGIDAEEVRVALEPRAVLEFYSWPMKRSADEFESSSCPQRSDHSRRAFLMNARSGRWQCFPCGTSGDLLGFIAGVERLQMPADFPTVLARAGEICGVGPSTLSNAERAQRRLESRSRRDAAEARDREERSALEAAAVPRATSYWDELERQHPRGCEYLCERGCGGAMPMDLVRFDPRHAGSPAIALHTRTGQIRNVVRRRLPELGEPKTPGLPECPTAGTLINSVRDISLMGNRNVVITEGVFDSITAAIAWPRDIVLGAHGSGNMAKIARVAAPAVASAKTKLYIVPHEDRAGYENALEAIRFAHEAGLSVLEGTLRIVKVGAKDLNSAWIEGWRPE